MKINKRRESKAVDQTAKDSNVGKEVVDMMYCITILMMIATVISGWNITGLWSGIVTMICAVCTVMLVNEITGGIEYDEEND